MIFLKGTLFKVTTIIFVVVVLSKILGFVREIFIAHLFGANKFVDAFFISQTIPSVLFAAAGASFGTALVPLLSVVLEKRGRSGIMAKVNNLLLVYFLVLSIVTLIGIQLAPYLNMVIAPGFDKETLNLSTRLTQVSFPMIIFLGLSYVLTAILQVLGKFYWSSLTGIAYNLVLIVLLVYFGSDFGVWGLTIFTLGAIAAQMIIQIPPLIYSGWKPGLRVNFREPLFKKALLLCFPIMIGSTIDQINIVVDRMMASGLEEGSVSALNYASKVFGLFTGLFSSSITVVIYTVFSRYVSEKNYESLRTHFYRTVLMVCLLVTPLSAILVILARPVIEIVFERGSFSHADTLLTATAFLFFVIGLLGFCLREITTRCFYALNDSKTPMVNGILAVFFNIILNLILVRWMGIGGLALSSSLALILTSILMLYQIKKIIGGSQEFSFSDLMKFFASVSLMSVVVYFLFEKSSYLYESMGIVVKFIIITMLIISGISLYIFLMYIFKVQMFWMMVHTVLMKFFNKNGGECDDRKKYSHCD